MNKTQAIARLTKIVGKKFALRENAKAPSSEERAERRIVWSAAKDAETAAVVARDARLRAIVAADTEYQRLKTDAAEATRAKEKAYAGIYHYRVEVLETGSIFNSVIAQGDNWQEVVEKIEDRARADA